MKKFPGDVSQGVLTQMQLVNSRETAEGLRVDGLDFIHTQIEQGETFEILEVLLANKTYKVLLQVQRLQLREVGEGVGCNFLCGK